MAHITGRRFGEAIVLSHPEIGDVLIQVGPPKGRNDDVDVRITAEQDVTISRAENMRTMEDRIKKAL